MILFKFQTYILRAESTIWKVGWEDKAVHFLYVGKIDAWLALFI